MKINKHFFMIIIILAITACNIFSQTIPTDSLYLGQIVPGSTPKVFNLAVTNGLRPVERIAITSDGKEIYYSELDTWPPSNLRIKCYKYSDNKWQGPTVVFEGFLGPGLADNDSTMYMQKNVGAISCTYFSKRTSTGWATPAMLLSATDQAHYFQKTKFNNFYLSSTSPSTSSNNDICRIVTVGTTQQIKSLGKPINTSDTENDFFVDRNESYLIFIRFGSNTASDLYISYKNDKGNWTNPKKFGAPINTSDPNWECCPFVSSDNKYLFFTRGGNYMNSYYTYWVKIDNIIDSLRHTNFVPFLMNQITTQTFPVNKSFTYTVPDSIFVDDDGNNTLTYSATLSNGNPLPAWLPFNPLTKTFTGNPTEVTSVSVKVTAKDTANASIACSFVINVTVASGVEDNKGELPKSLNLNQNYPNPFNPTTTIEFAIHKTGRYSLKLYNTVGELVKVISDKEYNAGNYNETFNAEALSSGMYIYRLTGEQATISRKMVILK